MENFYYGGEIKPELLLDVNKKDELMSLLKKANYFLRSEDELLLFRDGYEKQRDEYLSHHALAEKNQWILFNPQNLSVLHYYIEHWVLASVFEAKLCQEAMAGNGELLMKYLDYHNLADSDNEKYLFEKGMERYRHFYISVTSFHKEEIEQKLFLPEYKEDLELYQMYKRMFFKQNLKYLPEGYSNDSCAMGR